MAVKCLALFWILFLSIIFQNIIQNVSSQAIQKVFRIGDELKFSCSPDDGNSTWWLDGKDLYNDTIRMNDGSYVLQISNVSVKNQGTYWCGPSWQQGMNITVLIGDLPSPPRNLYTTSIEMNKILHWTSALSTGDLPVNYTVIVECTTQCNDSTTEGELFVPALLAKCNGLKHINGKNYSCDLRSADLFHQYRATVYAINPLGNSSKTILFQRPDIWEPKTTPAPPIAMKATEVQPGQVKVSWKNKDSSYRDIVCYRITYKREIDKNIKTLPDQCKADTSVLIDNLDADTTYTFFVMRQFRTPDLNSSFSDPADVSLHTKYQTPAQPPQNLKCKLMGKNSRNNTIKLTWDPPAKQYRNGPLTVYKIYYNIAESANSSIMIVNASQTQANLTVAGHLGNKLEMHSRVCNRAGLCSGISNSCFVPLSGLPNPGKRIPNSNHTKITIIGSVLGLLAGIAVIIALYYSCRKKKRSPFPLPLEIDGPYAHMYEETEDPPDDYATPLVYV